MTSTRIKVYGRKRARQSSSSGSSAEHPEDKSSSTPPLDATITLDDMARKMRRRAARVRRSSSNSSKKKSAAPSREFEPPTSKKPKLARADSMQVDTPTKAAALSSVSPSERNILAGLSSGPQRRRTLATSSMLAKENRDEGGRVLSSRRAQTPDAMLTPLAPSASRPGPSSARLASPLRLSTSGDPFIRRRQHTVAARHSYAPGKAARGRSRRSDASVSSYSSARRRTSVQVQKTRLSNSWLLSPPHIEPQSLNHPSELCSIAGSSDNMLRFPLSRPIAFSTPTRAKKLQQRASEARSDDLMQIDEPPAFLAPSSQPRAAPSSRQTHASATTFNFSAAVSTIGSAVPSVRAATSPLRYATPDAPAAAAPISADPTSDEERRSDGEARGPEPSPASSGGDELRDMFNVLGLDEDERWTRLTSEGDFSLDLFKPPSPSALQRTATRRGARSVRFAPPTIKMRTLSSPLKSNTSGSEDELLLKAGDVWADPESDL
ncbi:hypothetical protein AURDEDRAFT_167132 [Auricularia subglabra TFB-10046 SS5]|nr:hypothetical protein AURDEDRAFT_167132 [Auricularia subglabra TFB-10046 SS5]